MEKDKFLADFREQFIDADTINIDLQTPFRQLDSWDSLTGMSVIVMIQDIYKVEMSDVDLKSCTIVNDIYQFVVNKQGK